uniref:Uncharacterized protein n=1 Tax=Arundo donax TaxID=35708 RepID=A0A0A9GIP1_ARUDO
MKFTIKQEPSTLLSTTIYFVFRALKSCCALIVDLII